MTGTISVRVDELRDGARVLGTMPAAPRSVTVGMGDLGSARADAAFERYYPTWSSECSAAVRSVERLAALLGAAADTYVRRDTEAARGFAGGARAF
ncbi:hypothetical protein ACIRCZ_07885 [Leifsonia sp. NPDC102414]|uniref:hypothetical protein n=1 Tax=unclassified Leifsonia TaxID=2663824 RepID=UPI000B05D238|nr:hypothetical protein [Leifsonia sp. Root227]